MWHQGQIRKHKSSLAKTKIKVNEQLDNTHMIKINVVNV